MMYTRYNEKAAADTIENTVEVYVLLKYIKCNPNVYPIPLQEQHKIWYVWLCSQPYQLISENKRRNAKILYKLFLNLLLD